MSRVKHIKRGSNYEVLGRGQIQTDTPLTDYTEVVMYRSEDEDVIWVRPVTEFDDGRFEALPDLAPSADCVADENTTLREQLAEVIVQQDDEFQKLRASEAAAREGGRVLGEAANRFCDAFANLENRGSGDANARNRQWHINWQERSDAYHALRQALTTNGETT